MPMTTEQVKLLDDLIYEYGEKTVAQAYELAGLTWCMAALGQHELPPRQRTRLHEHANRHLAELIHAIMAPADSVRLAECAKRMNPAWELWMLEDAKPRRR